MICIRCYATFDHIRNLSGYGEVCTGCDMTLSHYIDLGIYFDFSNKITTVTAVAPESEPNGGYCLQRASDLDIRKALEEIKFIRARTLAN